MALWILVCHSNNGREESQIAGLTPLCLHDPALSTPLCLQIAGLIPLCLPDPALSTPVCLDPLLDVSYVPIRLPLGPNLLRQFQQCYFHP